MTVCAFHLALEHTHLVGSPLLFRDAFGVANGFAGHPLVAGVFHGPEGHKTVRKTLVKYTTEFTEIDKAFETVRVKGQRYRLFLERIVDRHTAVQGVTLVGNVCHDETLVREHTDRSIYVPLRIGHFQELKVIGAVSPAVNLLVEDARTVERGDPFAHAHSVVGLPENSSPFGALLLGIGRVVHVADFFAVKKAVGIDMSHVFYIAVGCKTGQESLVQAADVAVIRKAACGARNQLARHPRKMEQVGVTHIAIKSGVGSVMDVDKAVNGICRGLVGFDIFAKWSLGTIFKGKCDCTFQSATFCIVGKHWHRLLDMVHALFNEEFFGTGHTFGTCQKTRFREIPNLDNLFPFIICSPTKTTLFTDCITAAHFSLVTDGSDTVPFPRDDVCCGFNPAVHVFKMIDIVHARHIGRFG